MKKTILIYGFLLAIVFVRINKVCEQDLWACQEVNKVDSKSSWQKNNQNQAEYIFLRKFRTGTTDLVRAYLPSPHSELLLGMTVGIDKLYEVPKFKVMLRDTGTIHVVVVSGYNVTLVYNAVIRFLGSPYKTRNMLIATASTFVFSVVSGFEPPVVRAWLMGSIIAGGKFYGRKINAFQVLVFTGMLLIIINPYYLYSLSFQLSFLATLSLIMFEPIISTALDGFTKAKSVFKDDLAATLAAQLLIWPYLSYKFGHISLLSPVVNALVLWTVPLATVGGSAFIILGAISASLSSIIANLVFIPLDFFVLLVEIFANFTKFMLEVEVSGQFLVAYYVLLTLFYAKTSTRSLR